MTSRKHILGTLKNALASGADETARAERARERVRAAAANLVPKRGQLAPAKRVALFREYAEAADATVVEVNTLASVPKAVTDFLAKHNLAAEAVRAPDPTLDAVPWGRQQLLELRTGKAEATDAAGISAAEAGIAETGTLMLASGETSPTTINFLPDNHIVVLHKEQVVGGLEDAWALLRKNGAGKGGGFRMPRTVNFVTGPSRSADIEQTLQLGAHGPRRLHIILVDEPRKDAKA